MKSEEGAQDSGQDMELPASGLLVNLWRLIYQNKLSGAAASRVEGGLFFGSIFGGSRWGP